MDPEGWARGIERRARPVAVGLVAVGAVALMAMMFLVVSDVTLRFLFDRPIIGSYELVQYLMVVFIFLAFPFAQFSKAHINVTLVVDGLPGRARAAVDSFTYLICLAIFVLMVWGNWEQTLNVLDVGESSSVLLIPKWPFQFVGVVGLGMLTVATLVDLLRSIGLVGGKGRKEGPRSLSQF
jgi:TRAP-type C4-dicarboxylate transport system permease small subunit